MKVVQVINGLGTGGAERSLAELIPRVAAAGIDVELVCLFRRDEGVEAEVLGGLIRPTFLESTTWPGRIRELRRVLRHVSPDVVHTTIFESDVIGRLAALRIAPVLTSLVNTSYEPERLGDPNVRRSRLRLTQSIDSVTARAATTHFHAITAAVEQSAIRRLRLRPDDITVIPRGRDRDRLGFATPERRARVRSELGIAPDTPTIVHVGRHEFQKGLVHLLRALPLLTTTDAVLLQAGRSGNASVEVADVIAEHALEPRVRLLGHRDDVGDLLCAADAFVFPSIYEGLGGSLLEAMALDTPIVASDVPAIREVLDDGRCGALVEPSDPDALAVAVDQVFAGGAGPQQRLEAARRRFDELHDLDEVTGRMIELYRRVAAEG